MSRIAIITCIDRRSAIARATLTMAGALAELADVTIYAEPTGQPLACSVPLRSIDDASIMANDQVVTVVGNSPFHIGAFHAARRMPSFVILHDVLLANLAAASLTLDELSQEFERFYGPERTSEAIRSAATPIPFWDGPNAIDAPLFEAAIQSATGIVVHSTFAERLVAPTTIAPVSVIPLAYARAWDGRPRASPRTHRPPLVVTLGHANVNKCHEIVIEALAELGRPEVRYLIAGTISQQRLMHLSSLASALGVANQIEISGAISDERVAQVLADADLCINLRNPAFESGSASLVEQMAAGKCIVVFDHGCYSDAPDDAVVKLPATSTAQSLATTVGKLLDDVARRDEIGNRARAHAAAEHSFASYAHSLLEAIESVRMAEPLNQLVRQVASITRTWGMPYGSPLAHRYASTIFAMSVGSDCSPP